MCGRYYLHLQQDVQSQYIKEIIAHSQITQFADREVFPSQNILVLIKQTEKIIGRTLVWGSDVHKQFVINARSETIHEKRMFQSMKRCVIPCNYFFEWKRDGKVKTKFKVAKKGQSIMYLAGLYTDDFVVILTGDAYGDMKKRHHRTPLIMDHKTMLLYLDECLDAKVDNDDLQFEVMQKHVQTSLFD